MDELRIGDQVIRYNRELTLQAYSSIESGGAEECGCSYCRNFSAQRDLAYPASFLALLDQLGIDSNKEGEVYELGPVEALRQYGGWFFFAGEFIEGEEHMPTDRGSGISYSFNVSKNLPRPNGDFGDDVLAVDFLTAIPWTVEGEP